MLPLPVAGQGQGGAPGCERCHGELELLRQHVQTLADARGLVVPGDQVAGSAHTGMACAECHQGRISSPWPSATAPMSQTFRVTSSHFGPHYGTQANVLAAEGMFVFQTTLNFFVPSGSGQAAVTMPLMAPLADVLGLSRQTAVFAFTCGDGFSNSIIPTSGLLMAMLGLAKIPYEKWLRFVFPLFLMLSGLAALFLAIAVWTGY